MPPDTPAPPAGEPAGEAAPLTLRSLPLFPLGAVLFPGGLLPLRVFEVRYLDMVRRCQEAGAPFGVVLLTQGQEVRAAVAAAEAFEPVGTLASISDLQQPQPGLLLLQAAGTSRFRIQSSARLPHGLWTADVELLPADLPVPVPPDLQASADALERLLQGLAARGAEDMPAPPIATPWQLHDCGWVANRWAELLPMPLELRQRLMSLDNPLMRLELVGDLLTRAGIG